MARRTTLYQRVRSPLIQGHSKLERPLWLSWLMGSVIGAAGLLVVVAVDPARATSTSDALRYAVDMLPSLVGWLVGSVVGAYLGASIGRGWGQRGSLVFAAIGALAAAAAGMALAGLIVAQVA